tara:strand:+ start:2559 stop:3503 length:945 start_codon:yes stop_codon:yes gene_type:complete
MIKKIKKKTISILFFFFISINFSLAEKVSIIYIVENSPITNVAISNEIKYLLLINEKLNQISKEDMVQYATKSILKEKIKEIELKKYYEFGKNNKIIDQNLNTFMKRLNITDNNLFDNLINEIGLSKEFIKKKIEIEFLWNQLIVQLYANKIIVDKDELRNKLKKKISSSSNLLKEYLLYEITFSPNTMEDFKKEYEEIKKSIEEIGFESSANIFSNSSSAKLGGKIGWVNESQLSKSIISNLQNLNLGEYTKPINIPTGNIILMIKDKREIKNNLSLEDELKKAISKETNEQFTQYSSIYFKKVELNTKIYEK